MKYSTEWEITIMNRPEMILFDYGGTLLYEPGFDWVNGEREVFKHVKKNPNHLTPEELGRFGIAEIPLIGI